MTVALLGSCVSTSQAATEAELAALRERLSVLEAGIGELKAALGRSGVANAISSAEVPPLLDRGLPVTPVDASRRPILSPPALAPSTSSHTESEPDIDAFSVSASPVQLLLACLSLMAIAWGTWRLRARSQRSSGTDSVGLSRMPDRRSEPPRMTITDTLNTTELKSVMTGALPTIGERPSAVAEAELFLSYGRTRQAEEVLREAIQREPADMESTLCLLELLASNRQVDAFNRLATQAWQITGAVGPVWKQIAALGNTLDPANDLYEVTRFATAPNVRIAFTAKGESGAQEGRDGVKPRASGTDRTGETRPTPAVVVTEAG
jgi:pilus assembly protein FimV